MARKSVIFLMGPTAAGKTALALRLYDELPIEIVSVDSALVYRRLNIGSAKPPPSLLAKYPHHLVDIREPYDAYSAADFRRDALQAIRGIHARGKVPLLVGGTGLYFRTLEHGIAELPPVPAAIRQQLREECEQYGSAVMHSRLHEIDPRSAARIHPNDPQRILRALEIYRASGRPMDEYFHSQKQSALPYELVKIVCAPAEKIALHEPITSRFEDMLARGFINEVRGLKQDSRLSLQTPALRAVGYRAVWQFLDGEKTHQQMVHDGIVATRRLAKRQYTWFRRENDSIWVDSYAGDAFETLLAVVNRGVFFEAN